MQTWTALSARRVAPVPSIQAHARPAITQVPFPGTPERAMVSRLCVKQRQWIIRKTEARLAERGRIPKIIVSWAVLVVCCGVGLFALVRLGMTWVDFSKLWSESPSLHPDLAGDSLLATAFFVGSVTAIQNQRRAGIIFLAFMPFVAFFFAYPGLAFYVTNPDGLSWIERPLRVTAVGLTVLFYVPFAAPLLALPNRKRAALVFAVAALLAITVFLRSRWIAQILPTLAGWSVAFMLPGLFWLITARRGWPPLIRPRPQTAIRRAAMICAMCLLISGLDVVLTLVFSALGSSLWTPDCSGRALFDHAAFPDHSVFTARMLYVGRDLQALKRPDQAVAEHVPGSDDKRVGDWAIAKVEERFWGTPWSRLVLLTDSVYWKDETYFIDGTRDRGLLTRWLPIVRGGPCSRTRPASHAAADLRVLHEAPSASGRRIIGAVINPEDYLIGWAPPIPPSLRAGLKISISGAGVTRTVTTDESGIYQIDDLPPGDYILKPLLRDDHTMGFVQQYREGRTSKLRLEEHGVMENDFRLFWNGLIEGYVRDESSKPAAVEIELQKPDGSWGGSVATGLTTADIRGRYRIPSVSPGRYMIVINPNGPQDDYPYDLQYYRASGDPAHAQVLAVGKGQQIRNIDFKVRRLSGRSVHVHVTRPNGGPAAGALVCIAYEGTRAYDLLKNAICRTETDTNGAAVVRVYGNSRVRLFTNAQSEKPGSNWMERAYSHRVEAPAKAFPENLGLVLNGSNP